MDIIQKRTTSVKYHKMHLSINCCINGYFKGTSEEIHKNGSTCKMKRNLKKSTKHLINLKTG
jgi:hypothetical protein